MLTLKLMSVFSALSFSQIIKAKSPKNILNWIFDLILKLIGWIGTAMSFLVNHIVITAIVIIVIGILCTLWYKTKTKRLQHHANKRVQKIYDRETKKEAKQDAKAQYHSRQNLIANCDRVISLLNDRIEIENSPTNLIWLRNQFNGIWQSLDHDKPVMKTPQELLNNYERWYPENRSELYQVMNYFAEQFNRIYRQ